MSIENSIRFEYHPIKNIQLLDKNPRVIDDEEFENLKLDVAKDPGFLMVLISI